MKINEPHLRYLLIIWHQGSAYDSAIDDIVASFDTIGELINFYRKNHNNTEFSVYDRFKGKTIDLDDYDFNMVEPEYHKNEDINEMLNDIRNAFTKACKQMIINKLFYWTNGNI